MCMRRNIYNRTQSDLTSDFLNAQGLNEYTFLKCIAIQFEYLSVQKNIYFFKYRHTVDEHDF